METFIFYNYLKWKKDTKNDTINKIIKMPTIPKLLIILLISSGILSIVTLFVSQKLSSIFIIIEVLSGIISFINSEKMFIDNSPQKYQDFKEYCKKLRNWLKNFDIKSEEQISTLKNRINHTVIEAKEKSKIKKENAEKWLQVLLIPIILAVANNIINTQTETNKVIAYIFSIMIVFLSIYTTTIALVSATSIFDNWQISKYERFYNELQSVLDIEFNSGK